MEKFDFLIIGGGIIGLTVASQLRQRFRAASIALLEKESDVALHASGRNSGVLHAGFYYTADSFKARFSVAGNKQMRQFCDENCIPVNGCGKLVVARDESEVATLRELKQRGERGGVTLQWVDRHELVSFDKNARTCEVALFSPTTATVDPTAVCQSLKKQLIASGVVVKTATRYCAHRQRTVITDRGTLYADYVVNCAGLYADKIARDYGFAKDLTMLPFKGVYLKYSGSEPIVQRNIYPVPNLANPFLGVHFTKTVDNQIKIGPTAIPAFWRENYHGFSRFNLLEFAAILAQDARLFFSDSFGFRRLALAEIKKYCKPHFVALAKSLVIELNPADFNHWSTPGIRAQLLHTKRRELVQDFVFESDELSFHVLNAVSPAFTGSFAIAGHIVDRIVSERRPSSC